MQKLNPTGDCSLEDLFHLMAQIFLLTLHSHQNLKP